MPYARPQNSKHYELRWLIKQNILDLRPFFKLQIKWLRNQPYKNNLSQMEVVPLVRVDYTTSLEYVTNFRDLWTLMAFKSHTQQQYCFQFSFNSGIVNCTLYIKLNSKGILIHKSTSNHPSVKLRRLKLNLTFNQPKHHSLRLVGANCSFTYLHKTIVKKHLQETRSQWSCWPRT
jgi:hypothetical protein